MKPMEYNKVTIKEQGQSWEYSKYILASSYIIQREKTQEMSPKNSF